MARSLSEIKGKKQTKTQDQMLDLLSLAQEKDLEQVINLLEKKKKPKMSLLQRIGSGLTAFEPSEAIYEKMYEGKKFIPEYIKDIGTGLKEAFTGKPVRKKAKKTFKDILLKEGMKDRPGKIDAVDLLGLTGDILLDPTTYLGGTVFKGIGKGTKMAGRKTGDVLSKTFPRAYSNMQDIGMAIGDAFKTQHQKSMRALKNIGTPEADRMARVLDNAVTKHYKGTPELQKNVINPMVKQAKELQKKYGEELMIKTMHAQETGIKTGVKELDDLAFEMRKKMKQIGELDLIDKEKISGLREGGYARRYITPEFKEVMKKKGVSAISGMPKNVLSKVGTTFEREFLKVVNEGGKEVIGNVKLLGLKRINKQAMTKKIEEQGAKQIGVLQRNLEKLLSKEIGQNIYIKELREYIKDVKKTTEKTPVIKATKELLEPTEEEYLKIVNSVINPKIDELEVLAKKLETEMRLSMGEEFLKGPVVTRPSKKALVKELQDKIVKTQNEIAEQVRKIDGFDFIDKKGKFYKNVLLPIQEANAWSKKTYGIKMFHDNPFKVNANRIIEHEQIQANKRFIETIKQFARPHPDGFIDNTGLKWSKVNLPEFKNLSLPAPIVKDMEQTVKILRSDEELGKLLNLYDKVHNLWKGSVYGWFPASHVTNVIGGIFHNYLAGVKNPIRYAQAQSILAGKAGEIVLKSGKKISYDQVRNWLKQYGITGEAGWLDVPEALSLQAQKSKALQILQKPQKLMSNIEDRVRTPLFIDSIVKGLSPMDAVKKVNKYHFDYSRMGLSEFERNILRRVIPFYTFTRNAIPLNIQQIFLQPQKYAAVFKTQRATGLKPGDEEMQYLPPYIRNKIALKSGDKYFANFKLPFEDVIGTLDDPLRGIGTMISPIYKIPLELMFNKNLFKGIDLDKDTNGKQYRNTPKGVQEFLEYREEKVPADTKKGRKGYTKYYVNPFKKYAIENFPFTSRLWSTFTRTMDGKEDPRSLLNLVTPVKIYDEGSLDYYKNSYEKDLLQEMQRLVERTYGGYFLQRFVPPKD